jgi:hypothetical protein
LLVSGRGGRWVYVYAELKKSLALRPTKSRTIYTDNKFHFCKFLWVRSTAAPPHLQMPRKEWKACSRATTMRRRRRRRTP